VAVRITSLADLCRCRHREFQDVMLNTVLVLGTQGAGKTALINHIIHAINQKYKECRQVNILTRFFGEVFKIADEERYAELREVIREAEIINIFIDDALTSAHSRKRSSEIDINFAIMRHVFRMIKSGTCSVDEAYSACVEVPCTLNVFFATQRYQLLSPQMREGCNVLIAKAIDLNPTYDEKNVFQRMLGDEVINFLRENVYRVHFLKDKAALSFFALKIIGKPAMIIKYSYTGVKPRYEMLTPVSHPLMVRVKRERVAEAVLYALQERGRISIDSLTTAMTETYRDVTAADVAHALHKLYEQGKIIVNNGEVVLAGGSR